MKDVQMDNKNLKFIITIISIVLFFVSILTAISFTKSSNLPKIAVVDNNYLVSQFSEAIAARKAFEQQKQEWDKNIKTIQDTLDTIVKEMSTNYGKSSPQKKTEMESRLNHWNQEYRRYLKAVDQMSAKKEQELMTPVLEQLNSFVTNWAKRNGYDVVIGSGNGGVILSAKEQYNVTDKILVDLNKMYQVKIPVAQTEKKDSGAATNKTDDTAKNK